MDVKPRLLILTDWYEPSFKAGGPVRSLTNLVHNIKHDFDIFILTSDRDLGDDQPYIGLELNTWIKKEGISIKYASPKVLNKETIRNEIEHIRPDVVYLNSMYSYTYTILPLQILRHSFDSIKLVLAPRGMLGKGALEIKPLKKKTFLAIGKLIGLFRKIHWHATDVTEEDEIKSVFGDVLSIDTISNLPGLQTEISLRSKHEGSLNLLFYSRISEKKNLKFLLEVLRDSRFKGLLNLEIFGPIEAENYWSSCQKLIGQIHGNHKNIQVTYQGPMRQTDLSRMLSQNHVLILPTKHENYGHVIAEAMSSGMPVILSQNTPWRNLRSIGVGDDLDLNDKNAFAQSIQDFINMGSEPYERMSKRSREFVLEKTPVNEIVNKYKALFLSNEQG